jgi:hypothetical protein
MIAPSRQAQTMMRHYAWLAAAIGIGSLAVWIGAYAPWPAALVAVPSGLVSAACLWRAHREIEG